MQEDQFWSIVDSAKPDLNQTYNIDNHYKNYYQAVSKLTENELHDFAVMQFRLKVKASSTAMMQAAYIVKSGDFSDDDFNNFLAGLIAQGKVEYYNALEDPEKTFLSLTNAKLLERCSMFDSTPYNVFEEKGGNPDSLVTEKDESLIEESGLTDDFSDDPTVLNAKFPELFMRFWRC